MMDRSSQEICSALVKATDDIVIAGEYEIPSLATLSYPSSHIHALKFNTQLVVGARGTGKTFWTNALQDQNIRQLLSLSVPDIKNSKVVVGHALQPSSDYPQMDDFSRVPE